MEGPGGVATGALGSLHLGPTPGGMIARQVGSKAAVGGATLTLGQIKEVSEAETMDGTETAWDMGPM